VCFILGIQRNNSEVHQIPSSSVSKSVNIQPTVLSQNLVLRLISGDMRTEKNSIAPISSNSSPELAENSANTFIAVLEIHLLSSRHADATASAQLTKNELRDLRLSFGITNDEPSTIFILDKSGGSVAQRLQFIELFGRGNQNLHGFDSQKMLNLFTTFRRV